MRRENGGAFPVKGLGVGLGLGLGCLPREGTDGIHTGLTLALTLTLTLIGWCPPREGTDEVHMNWGAGGAP